MNTGTDAGSNPAVDEYTERMQSYFDEALIRARAIPNRGPVRKNRAGKLSAEIVEAYRTHGFYIFEGVVDAGELQDLRMDVDFLLEHAPTGRKSEIDARGRRAFGLEFTRDVYTFVKPLSDPWGGTKALSGRHQVQMAQPDAGENAPDEVVQIINGLCQVMPSALRLYGHPDLLQIAESINGADFVPYTEVAFVKLPGLGGAVSWHQDGVTHWDNPDWDQDIHGFNFQIQLYPCTAANSLWVVPGSHKLGRIDIRKMVADNNHSDRLPDAVPLLCEPGDVTIANRQILHGSFPNTSPDLRVSLTFGFHKRASVLGVGALESNSLKESSRIYDAEFIGSRARIIELAIDARSQHFPAEKRFRYQPFLGQTVRFDPAKFDDDIRDYNLKDLAI